MKFREVQVLRNKVWYFEEFDNLKNGDVFCFSDNQKQIFKANSNPVPITDSKGVHRGNMSIDTKYHSLG